MVLSLSIRGAFRAPKFVAGSQAAEQYAQSVTPVRLNPSLSLPLKRQGTCTMANVKFVSYEEGRELAENNFNRRVQEISLKRFNQERFGRQ